MIKSGRRNKVRLRMVRMAAAGAGVVALVLGTACAWTPVSVAAGNAGAGTAPAATMLPEPSLAPPPGLATTPMIGPARGAAPKPGTGRWYWPVGTEDFGGYSSWLASRGSYVHVAQDMPSSVGHPVYAVGDGVVWIARADAGGYGPGGRPGGCMVIVHVTASGQEFRALYGHVSRLLYREGQRVVAGAVIARVNGCGHLHFSIHPSEVYRDRNPYAGHVPKSWADHGGFVDPVRYLRTHPREISYAAPVLPRVDVVTATAPLSFGAVAGAAYWTEEGGAGAARFRLDLESGERRTLTPDEVVPQFDGERYVARLLGGSALGFCVSDRLPILSVGSPHTTPPKGEAARLTGRLTNAAGKPFRGGCVQLERLSGDAWVRVARALTLDDGEVSFDFVPPDRTELRLRFLPPATQPPRATYLQAASAPIVIRPHIGAPAPTARIETPLT
jgi:hypothetical protein